MTLDNFTITKNPFTGEPLTDSNARYIDADNGSDNNTGTRNSPFKSLSNIQNNNTYVLRGSFPNGLNIINFVTGCTILGDLNTEITGTLSIEDYTGISSPRINFFNIKLNYLLLLVNKPNLGSVYCNFINVHCASFSAEKVNTPAVFPSTSYFGTFSYVNSLLNPPANQITCDTFNQQENSNLKLMTNSIMAGAIHLALSTVTGGGVEFQNCIIRKQAEWRWNNRVIPISWTVNGNEIQDIKNSVMDFADAEAGSVAQADSLKSQISRLFGAGTLVYDDSDPNIRLFNAYDEQGNVTDYTLNRANGNPALFSSDSKSYVGCYRPSIKVEFDFDSVENLDDDGNAIGAGDLLKNNDGIFCDVDSEQGRNRVISNVVTPARGDRFTQFRCNFRPSDAFYLGALQPVPGLGKINAMIVEPYDDPSTPSAFPMFCAPINEEVRIAYFTAGDKAGQPVLFSDLAGLGLEVNKNLTEAGAWAVTNACDEWDEVIGRQDTTGRTPAIRFFRLHLIVNRV